MSRSHAYRLNTQVDLPGPVMLHLYAALAGEEDRRSEARYNPRAAEAAIKAYATKRGRRSVSPVISCRSFREIQTAGTTFCGGIAAALNAVASARRVVEFGTLQRFAISRSVPAVRS